MHTRDISVGGRTISIETGRLAKQADGAVIVRLGDTMVLVTACADANPREGVDFLPLTCDYKENAYASGRIPGGFFKREGKPPEKEVLTSRLIDRPIRPLFPDGWRNETQIIALVISADTDNDSDVLAITGASAALALSSIPQSRTLAGRARRLRGRRLHHQPDLRAAQAQHARPRRRRHQGRHRDGRGGREGSAGRADGPGARARRTRRSRRSSPASTRWRRRPASPSAPPRRRRRLSADLVAEVEGKVLGPLGDAMRIKDKLENYATVDKVINDYLAAIYEEDLELKTEKKLIAKGLKEKILRDEILERGQRLDGRKFDEIRKITIEVGVLPRTHGSCLFTRGETQALVIATLGTADDQQKVETVDGETWKRFMLHYNFPPFSVGEVKFLRGPGRREIGHGALAERSLAADDAGRRELPLHRARRLRDHSSRTAPRRWRRSAAGRWR